MKELSQLIQVKTDSLDNGIK